MDALRALQPTKRAGFKRARAEASAQRSGGGGAAADAAAPSFLTLGDSIQRHFAALGGAAAAAAAPDAAAAAAPAPSAAAAAPPPPALAEDCRAWGLHADLQRALQREGVTHFFPVQRALIPLLAAADAWDDPALGDVCVSAPTGSGKTLAYAAPLLQCLLRERAGATAAAAAAAAAQPRPLHALIVLPTRDLAVQVHAVLARLAGGLGGGGLVRVLAATGQASYLEERAALEGAGGGVDILVASPGRLMEHLDGTPALARALRGLRVLVVDEADRLLAESYQDWVRRINVAVFGAEDPGRLGAYLCGWQGASASTSAAAAAASEAALGGALALLPQASRVWQGEGSRVGAGITPLAQPPPAGGDAAAEAAAGALPPWLAAALAPARHGAPAAAAAAARLQAPLHYPDPLPAPFRRVLCSATLSRNPLKLSAMGLRAPTYIHAAGAGARRGAAPPASSGSAAAEEAGQGGALPPPQPAELLTAAGKRIYALPSALHQAYVVCAAGEKPVALMHLLRLLEGQHLEAAGGCGGSSEGAPRGLRALIFTNSVETAHRLTRLLQLMGGLRGACVEFTAGLSQAKRTAVLGAALAGAISVLVASDAAARGLDLPSLPAVIHYDAPPRAKTYVHRVGRTARAGRVGLSYAIVRPEQARHFKALLARTAVVGGGGGGVAKETLPRVLCSDYAPRITACLARLKEVLEAEAAGTLKPTKVVPRLEGEGGEADEQAMGAAAAAVLGE